MYMKNSNRKKQKSNKHEWDETHEKHSVYYSLLMHFSVLIQNSRTNMSLAKKLANVNTNQNEKWIVLLIRWFHVMSMKVWLKDITALLWQDVVCLTLIHHLNLHTLTFCFATKDTTFYISSECCIRHKTWRTETFNVNKNDSFDYGLWSVACTSTCEQAHGGRHTSQGSKGADLFTTYATVQKTEQDS